MGIWSSTEKKEENESQTTNSEDQVQAMLKNYKEHLRCENIHDPAGVVLTCTEDCVFSFSYLPGYVFHKREGAKQMYELLFSLFPDFHYEPLDYIIGKHGIAARGEITGHLSCIQKLWNALGYILPWITEGEPKKEGLVKFRQSGWIGWDSKQKLFTGERFYLFYKDAKKHLHDDSIELEFHSTTSHKSLLDALNERESSLDMSAEKAEIVEKLWNEDGKAPEFEKIFSPNTSVKVILNESEVTLGADKAKSFYNWVRPAEGEKKYYLIIAGVQGVMIASIRKSELRKEGQPNKDGTKRKRRKEFVATFYYDAKSGLFNAMKIDLNHKSIPKALCLH